MAEDAKALELGNRMTEISNGVKHRRLGLWAIVLSFIMTAALLVMRFFLIRPVYWYEAVGTVERVVMICVTLIIATYIGLSIIIGLAAVNKDRNGAVWGVIAFFFGLVIPAIIIATMAPTHSTAMIAPVVLPGRTCQFCAEDIHPDAIKCKHCGEMLTSA